VRDAAAPVGPGDRDRLKGGAGGKLGEAAEAGALEAKKSCARL